MTTKYSGYTVLCVLAGKKTVDKGIGPSDNKLKWRIMRN